MNAEKLAKLQAQVRLGGKGTARRKKKVVHKTAATDDKKLQSCLKKISVNPLPNIEEVNMMKDDGTVMHFINPKVQASLASNTFAVAGHAENKQITELLPGILNQLGSESLSHLRKLAGGVGGLGHGDAAGMNDADDDEDDDVPDLVENFDEVCKDEVPNICHTDESKAAMSEADLTEEEKKTGEADGDKDDDIPDLVENSDEPCNDEVPNVSHTDESKASISEVDLKEEEKGANEADDNKDDDVTDLVENLDEACKNEVPDVSHTDESKGSISEADLTEGKKVVNEADNDKNDDAPDLIENVEQKEE